MSFKVVELFAGVGGFRVGLNKISNFDGESGLATENGRWKFVWANQWEPGTKVQHAFDCYVERFGKSNIHVNEDISMINKKTLPDHDLLVGGFPCQDYSVARSLTNEKGITGKKGVLWWEILETIREKNTQFILLENVDRLLKSPASNRGRDFAIMLKSLNELGYIVEWRVINAAEYNMPQRRRRVFIFAFDKNSDYGEKVIKEYSNNGIEGLLSKTMFSKTFPIQFSGPVEVKDLNTYNNLIDLTDNYSKEEQKFENSGIMIDGMAYHSKYSEISEVTFPLNRIIKESSAFNSDYDNYKVTDPKKWEYLKGPKSIKRVSKDGFEYHYSEGQMIFPDDVNKPARTMLTSESTVNRSSHIVHMKNKQDGYRTITEVEAELLNMFPANWTDTGMSKRARYFTMGNALVTGIINRVENELYKIISGDATL